MVFFSPAHINNNGSNELENLIYNIWKGTTIKVTIVHRDQLEFIENIGDRSAFDEKNMVYDD